MRSTINQQNTPLTNPIDAETAILGLMGRSGEAVGCALSCNMMELDDLSSGKEIGYLAS
jgi:hypothetical protein